MARKPRELQEEHCHHVTVRCNSREFRLTQRTLKETLLHSLATARKKYLFRLYALCIMSNHVHYLLEPAHPRDLPKIMHYLNWHTAMCCNRLFNRTGHFWEQRYRCASFPSHDRRRALNTLRYIHANPAAAGMRQGFFYSATTALTTGAEMTALPTGTRLFSRLYLR